MKKTQRVKRGEAATNIMSHHAQSSITTTTATSAAASRTIRDEEEDDVDNNAPSCCGSGCRHSTDETPVMMTTAIPHRPDCMYTIRHHEAFLLDVRILERVLDRNAKAHGRTMYYRRTNMVRSKLVATATTPYAIRNLYEDHGGPWRQHMQSKIRSLSQQRRRSPCSSSRTTSLQRDFVAQKRQSFWDTMTQRHDPSNPKWEKNHHDDDDMDIDRVIQEHVRHILETTMDPLVLRATVGITQCIERIQYAYRACQTEIQRGFFLPIMTVLVACMARIRILLLRLQYTIVMDIVQHCTELLQVLPSSTTTTLTAIQNDTTTQLIQRIRALQHRGVQIVSDVVNQCSWTPTTIGTMSRTQRTEQTLGSLGLQQLPKKRPLPRRNNNSSTKVSSSTQSTTTNAIPNDGMEEPNMELCCRNERMGDVGTTSTPSPIVLPPLQQQPQPQRPQQQDDIGEPYVDYTTTIHSIPSSTLGTVPAVLMTTHTVSTTTTTNTTTDNTTTTTTSTKNRHQPDDDPMDQNWMMVMQQQKKKQRQQQHEMKHTTRSVIQKIPKNSKKKKGDFFDQLFG
jgi:hypothetical protein